MSVECKSVAGTKVVPHGGRVSGIAIAVEGRPPARPGEEMSLDIASFDR